MEAIKLNNGIEIPALGFGTWKIGTKYAEQAVLDALEAGYRHIDTAAIYGNEKEVGNAIKKSGVPREEIFVTTKLWNGDHDNVEKAFEESLKKLQLEYIDLYLIHFPVKERNASWKILEQLNHGEVCKSIGVSNFTIRHLNELLKFASTAPVVDQVEFHPYLYQRELLEFCKSKNIHVEAYSPLTHGERINDPKLIGIADKYGKSSAQILIRWSVQHGMIVLPKSAHKERIIENIDVFDFDIRKEDMGALDNFNEDLRTCWDPTNAP